MSKIPFAGSLPVPAASNTPQDERSQRKARIAELRALDHFTAPWDLVMEGIYLSYIDTDADIAEETARRKAQVLEKFSNQEVDWVLKRAECEYRPDEEFTPADFTTAYKIIRFKIVLSFIQIIRNPRSNRAALEDLYHEAFRCWTGTQVRGWWYKFCLYWHDHKDEFDQNQVEDLRHKVTYARMATKGTFFEPYVQEYVDNGVIKKL